MCIQESEKAKKPNDNNNLKKCPGYSKKVHLSRLSTGVPVPPSPQKQP